MNNEKVLVLDFGGQYNQLIARRVRDLKVYSEVKPYTTPIEDIKKENYKGIIFTGGPNSVYEKDSPAYSKEIFDLGIPIFGFCYGHQFIAHALGGRVATAEIGEYGKAEMTCDFSHPLFKGMREKSVVWMSHRDAVSVLPEGFKAVASTKDCKFAGIANDEKRIYGVQFHPEVEHSEEGQLLIKNFLFEICHCKGDWVMSSFVKDSIEKIREKVGDKKVLCALSGGVDSSVCAILMHKAIGDRLTCIFVDHGLLRKDEGDLVESIFTKRFDVKLIRVNAEDRFLGRLKEVSDPERKRKIIGEEFIRVFEDEAHKLGKVNFLVQGTIYPDVIESGLGSSAVIKSHHNVGGLPFDIDFDEIIEPLRLLFKDEVRKVGTELGIPDDLVWRQPFPGPGLAVRILGAITPEKVKTLQDADAIFREEVRNFELDRELSQYFAVLTDIRSVGVMGDGRTYDYTLALRAVKTTDFMTATFCRLPYDLLEKVASRISNEVRGINRVVYDVTSKPPATIEWE